MESMGHNELMDFDWKYHYNAIIWPLLRCKLPATLIFVQQRVHVNKTESIEVLYPLWGSLSQRAGNATIMILLRCLYWIIQRRKLRNYRYFILFPYSEKRCIVLRDRVSYLLFIHLSTIYVQVSWKRRMTGKLHISLSTYEDETLFCFYNGVDII